MSVSVAVARALLDNAGRDEVARLRPHLSVGIDRGCVAATDGHTLVRFERAEVDPNGRMPAEWSGRYWVRPYVEARLEMALKAGRKSAVLLEWSAIETGGFPPVTRVEPNDGAETLKREVGLNPAYLARLELVAKACRREREPGDKEAPPLPAAVLTSIGDALDPMRFVVGGTEHIGYLSAQHTAHFTIIPLRVGYTTAPPKLARKPRAKESEGGMTDAAGLRHKVALLQGIADGLRALVLAANRRNPRGKVDLCALEVVFATSDGAKYEFSVEAALDAIVNDTYWDERGDWSDASTAEVRFL